MSVVKDVSALSGVRSGVCVEVAAPARAVLGRRNDRSESPSPRRGNSHSCFARRQGSHGGLPWSLRHLIRRRRQRRQALEARVKTLTEGVSGPECGSMGVTLRYRGTSGGYRNTHILKDENPNKIDELSTLSPCSGRLNVVGHDIFLLSRVAGRL